MTFNLRHSFPILKTALLSAVFCYMGAAPLSIYSQDSIPADTSFSLLPGLEVRAEGKSPFFKKTDGSLEMRSRDVGRLTRTLGEADFINILKSISSVSSGSDYSSGFSADGSNPTQVQYLADNVPVTFPFRFGGIFSAFNPAFYSSMEYTPVSPACLPPRLGPSLEFRSSDRFSPGVEGSLGVGLMASSLGIRGGVAGKASISLGGRVSYVDRLYGKWLNASNHALGFSFHDLNAALAVRLSSADILRGTFFLSADRVGYDDRHYAIDTRLNWKNIHYALSLTHQADTRLEASIYRTLFSNRLTLRMPQFELLGPSSLDSYGARLKLEQNDMGKLISAWDAGMNIEFHHADPQSAEMWMGEEIPGRRSSPIGQRMLTASLFASLELTLRPDLSFLRLESDLGIYSSSTSGNQYTSLLFSPKVTYRQIVGNGELLFSAGLSAQPLHQVGFSELGLASDFWIGACRRAPMQRAADISARMSYPLPWWNLRAEGRIYWKWLRNQTEYQGAVMEVIDTDYDPFSHLSVADGYNYGVSASIRRTIGNITGEAGYSFDQGRRHDSSASWYALNAAGHTGKVSLVWRKGKHWIFSTTFRISSGRRYTPVKALYAISGNIALEYCARNSARLPSYQRLDLGATYIFRTSGRLPLTHSLNLSILNAYGHRNVEMQYFILNAERGDYTLKRLYSLYRFLPSLSYTIDF
ncbi:MAG: hypothetical protein K2J70_00970 [Muribaculaceae bacterium]|nr:hypothetical protein [Muribaculaceae bacterium]